MRFENTEVWGFQHAIRGMRNPMNSWDKSDSYWSLSEDGSPINPCDEPFLFIGKNDLSLMQKLIRAGSEHRKFMRQIFVSVDITAPLYWWKEMDTYKIGTTANSTSTMHKLTSSPITLECFEIDDYDGTLIFEEGIDDYGDTETPYNYTVDDAVGKNETNYCPDNTIIGFLEKLRTNYLETKDKRIWKELVRWLPKSWLQTRTVTMNYENLYTIYHQRKNHKLNEWSGINNKNIPNFISWIESLPYAKELIIDTQREMNDKD